MRKPLIAANWKLNGDLALCRQFAETFVKPAVVDKAESVARRQEPEILVCPPAVYLAPLAAMISANANLVSGAQNVATESDGAYTGEIAASMLAEVGATYCIVGHSERRALFGETDEDVLIKCKALAGANIIPVLCIGEQLAVREEGCEEEYVAGQLKAVLSNWSGVKAASLVLAYEPVWAIGTGMSATPEQVQQMHSAIRKLAGEYLESDELRILYGGSVKASNAAELLALDDVDGALVGGASLLVEEFGQIVSAACQ